MEGAVLKAQKSKEIAKETLVESLEGSFLGKRGGRTLRPARHRALHYRVYLFGAQAPAINSWEKAGGTCLKQA
jgi:hypothetical protein